MTKSPSLPRLYELIQLERADSAMAEARRQAEAGAEEGTLIWVGEQSAGAGRLGTEWVSPPGNLYCALVLQPEDPLDLALDLHYVMMVAMGAALGEVVAPMTSVRFRWPNDVMVNEAKCGAVWVEAPPASAGHVPWLTLGIGLNVMHFPRATPTAATSLAEEACPEATDRDLLERLSRQFLSWVNRWANEGFEPVRKAWLQKADGIGEPMGIALKDHKAQGVLIELGERGELVLEQPDGSRRTITVADAFGISL